MRKLVKRLRAVSKSKASFLSVLFVFAHWLPRGWPNQFLVSTQFVSSFFFFFPSISLLFFFRQNSRSLVISHNEESNWRVQLASHREEFACRASRVINSCYLIIDRSIVSFLLSHIHVTVVSYILTWYRYLRDLQSWPRMRNGHLSMKTKKNDFSFFSENHFKEFWLSNFSVSFLVFIYVIRYRSVFNIEFYSINISIGKKE